MASDLAPLFPEKFRLIAEILKCGGNPDDPWPPYYKSDVNLSDVEFSDPDIKDQPEGVSGTILILRDTVCATLTSAGADPTNKTPIDDLAAQLAGDIADWASWSIDKVYNGVAAVTPTGLLDTIEFRMDAADSWTRVQGQPWGGALGLGGAAEFQHQDNASVRAIACQESFQSTTDVLGHGVIIDIPGGIIHVADLGLLTIEDGRLRMQFAGGDNLPACGCGSGTSVCGYLCVTVYGCGLSDPVSGVTVKVTAHDFVSSVTLTNGGTAYTAAPAVSFSGGGGTGAAAVCAISGGGVVTSITLTNGGSGYTTPPTVSFVGGGGMGATATAMVTADATIGTCTTAQTVAGVTVTAPGSGYTAAPTVVFTGGGGMGAAATANLSGGGVGSVTVTNRGGGYTSAPTVSFVGGGGMGVTATALMDEGQCCVPLHQAGTFDIEATPHEECGLLAVDDTYTTATCAGIHDKTVQLGVDTGFITACCGPPSCTGYPLPATVRIDDGMGPVTCTYAAGGGFGAGWYGTASRGSTAMGMTACEDDGAPGSVTVTFFFGCSLDFTGENTIYHLGYVFTECGLLESICDPPCGFEFAPDDGGGGASSGEQDVVPSSCCPLLAEATFTFASCCNTEKYVWGGSVTLIAFT